MSIPRNSNSQGIDYADFENLKKSSSSPKQALYNLKVKNI